MINLDKYGNMSAASIPVALAEAVEQGQSQRRRLPCACWLRRRLNMGSVGTCLVIKLGIIVGGYRN